MKRRIKMVRLKNKLSVFFLLLIIAPALAEIKETQFISEAFSEIIQGDVIVLDIDNTILRQPKLLEAINGSVTMLENL